MWRVGTVVALYDETASSRTLTLEVPDWPGHVAGQHVDVRLTAPDGYSAARSYSIASAPNSEKWLQITVDRLPNGEVSPYLTQELAVGDRLELRGPIGGWFVWRSEQMEPVQLIAGGSGIVPLMAMIRSRASSGSAAPFRLMYSVREPASVFYGEELRTLADRGYCAHHSRLYTSGSAGLAAAAWTNQRRSNRERDVAVNRCTDMLRLRPDFTRGGRFRASHCVWP